jgi:Cu/Ag efflux protein CusF
MKRIQRLIVFFVATMFVTAMCLGQAAPANKPHTFHGKVESVDEAGKSITVDGEAVEGWMGAMTMDYKVDDPMVLKKVKPGDRIAATVYDGDYSLHKVQVMPKTAGSATNSTTKK